VLTLAMRPYHADTATAVPIDVISTSEFSQMTKGIPNAKAADQPKPVAEKVGPAVPVDDPMAKVANKEIKAPPTCRPTRTQAARAQGQEGAAAATHRSDRGRPEKNDDKKPEPRRRRSSRRHRRRQEAAAAEGARVRSPQDGGAAQQARTDALGDRRRHCQ